MVTRLVVILVLLVTFYFGLAGAAVAEDTVGAKDSFTIITKEKCNRSAFELMPNQLYQLQIEKITPLQDGQITCRNPGPKQDQCHEPTTALDHDGFETEGLTWWRKGVLFLVKPFTPLSSARWFELVCKIGDDGYFVASDYMVGKEVLVAKKGGRLSCRVNDFPFKYGNNIGELRVTIKEVRQH